MAVANPVIVLDDSDSEDEVQFLSSSPCGNNTPTEVNFSAQKPASPVSASPVPVAPDVAEVQEAKSTCELYILLAQ